MLRASHRRVAVCAAVLGAASAFASPALAETPHVPAVPALPDTTSIVAAALDATQPVVTPTPVPALPAPAPAVTSTPLPVPPQPESVPPADPATAAPLEQATTAPVEVPPPTPVQAPVEAPEPLPDPPAAPVATAPAVPEPVEQAVQPVEQAVQQVQPVNVNISVRFDSPGDNGAVTQINAALSQPFPVAEPPEVRYQAPDPQYHDPLATGAASVAPAAPADPAPTADAPVTPVDSWDWTWTWSCGDVISPTIVLPPEYLQQIWNWNWNWNCGGNTNPNGNSGSQSPPQYQPVTSQYQPINVNISIRIASPGNDGPVVQTNLALAMPVIVQTATNHSAPLPVQWLPSPVASVQVSTEIGQPMSAQTAAVPSGTLLAPAQDSASAERGLISETAGDGAKVIRSVLQPAPDAGRGDTTRATSGSAPVPVSAAQVAALAPPAPAVAAGERAKAQQQRPTTHARPILPQSVAATAVSYASVGPLGAGGSDRTLWLIFLFSVPFLLAFADAARRIREEWKAEAADSGRRREKPG